MVQVSKVDNNLIIVAFNGTDSYELCSIKSGYHHKVDVTMPITAGTFKETFFLNGLNGELKKTIPQRIPKGTYSLCAVGIDWGVEWDFNFTFNGQNPNDKGKETKGVVFKPDLIQFTVN